MRMNETYHRFAIDHILGHAFLIYTQSRQHGSSSRIKDLASIDHYANDNLDGLSMA